MWCGDKCVESVVASCWRALVLSWARCATDLRTLSFLFIVDRSLDGGVFVENSVRQDVPALVFEGMP